MELFVQAKVFNPALVGKAVRITGYDEDGVSLDGLYLVKHVAGEKIQLVKSNGNMFSLHMESFEPHIIEFTGEEYPRLIMTVLEG